MNMTPLSAVSAAAMLERSANDDGCQVYNQDGDLALPCSSSYSEGVQRQGSSIIKHSSKASKGSKSAPVRRTVQWNHAGHALLGWIPVERRCVCFIESSKSMVSLMRDSRLDMCTQSLDVVALVAGRRVHRCVSCASPDLVTCMVLP